MSSWWKVLPLFVSILAEVFPQKNQPCQECIVVLPQEVGNADDELFGDYRFVLYLPVLCMCTYKICESVLTSYVHVFK